MALGSPISPLKCLESLNILNIFVNLMILITRSTCTWNKWLVILSVQTTEKYMQTPNSLLWSHCGIWPYCTYMMVRSIWPYFALCGHIYLTVFCAVMYIWPFSVRSDIFDRTEHGKICLTVPRAVRYIWPHRTRSDLFDRADYSVRLTVTYCVTSNIFDCTVWRSKILESSIPC